MDCAPQPASPPPLAADSREGAVHFVGIAGIGMSALAHILYGQGAPVSGSDRYLDLGQAHHRIEKLRALGVRLFPQDGSGVSPRTRRVIVSTAIEQENPDIVRARTLAIPIAHRSELLAELFHRWGSRVAVTGSCGKTTVTAMIGWILNVAGLDPTVINGGVMRNFEGTASVGNAVAGRGDVGVIEADESDGTCALYRPTVGVVSSIARDHQETDRILELYRHFVAGTERVAVLHESLRREFDHARRCRVVTFGLEPEADMRAQEVRCGADGSEFRTDLGRFRLNAIGLHNVRNALAALAVCRELGTPADAAAEGLATFQGVERRLEVLGVPRGARVYDDYAHSPAKLRAAIEAARAAGAVRILAVFQPHGFGPARFMREELAATLAQTLRDRDRLWLLPIYYVGGTVAQDISSDDLAAECRRSGARVEAAPSRESLVEALADEVGAGDAVLVMGARDDTLSDLALGIVRRLAAAAGR